MSQVSYAVTVMLSAVGDGKLMPASPDYPVLVINTHNGYVRQNQSWVLGRILRDLDYWQDKEVGIQEERFLDKLRQAEDIVAKLEKRQPNPVRVGLRLSVYEALPNAGQPVHDIVRWTGLAISALQLGVAAVPCAVYHDWLTLFVTGAGTILAFITGALPQWAEEKLACKRGSKKNVALTTGNGAHDVVVVFGRGHGLDLEDLASSAALPSRVKMSIRVMSFLVAVGWLGLLVSVAGYQRHTWFLLAVGGIGVVHNVFVAGVARHPRTCGIHLAHLETMVDRKVMDVLASAEIKYPKLGASLLPIFFPGKLRTREKQFWDYAERRATAYEDDGRIDGLAKMHAMPDIRGTEAIPSVGFVVSVAQAGILHSHRTA